MESIVHRNPHAHLIRINLNHPEMPSELMDRAISFGADALQIITEIWKGLGLDS
jgi:hypothetical protein